MPKKQKRVLISKKQMESEKMMSLGILAAGMAHEVNNPMGFISSNLETFQTYLETMSLILKKYQAIQKNIFENEDVLEQLKEVKKLEDERNIGFVITDSQDLLKESIEGARRIKEIVLGLKSISGQNDYKIRKSNINTLLESTLAIMSSQLKYHSEVIRDLDPRVPEIFCYPDHLNQVFLNILLNASQAIQKDGRIEVSSHLVDTEIEIQIKDNGCGIPPEVMQRIFEPFYTTKEAGEGTGLGLAIAHDILQMHHGQIEVSSEEGKGSVFVIRLPVQGVGEESENE